MSGDGPQDEEEGRHSMDKKRFIQLYTRKRRLARTHWEHLVYNHVLYDAEAHPDEIGTKLVYSLSEINRMHKEYGLDADWVRFFNRIYTQAITTQLMRKASVQ